MHPILFKLGSFNIYSYGAMVAFAFGLVAVLAYARASKFGIDRDKVVDLFVVVLIAGIVGARTLFVILNIGYYIYDPLEVFNLTKGGLVWYGGFAAAVAAGAWFVRRNKMDFWNTVDFIAPYIALGQSVGRIGCFLNGCCYGIMAPENFVFGQRHPAQIYSAFALFIIFILLLSWQGRKHFNGEIFLGYCLLYSCKRFLMEFFRGDNPRAYFGLTISQLISLAAFAAALYVFMIKRSQWLKKRSSA